MSYVFDEQRPASVAEAFANTAKALEQFKVERVRIEGLSNGRSCVIDANNKNVEEIRTLSEQVFMREFVFQSRPCVIVDALDNWPAMKRWRDDTYLFDLDAHLAKVKNVDQETVGTSKKNTTASMSFDSGVGNTLCNMSCSDFSDGSHHNLPGNSAVLGESRKDDTLRRVTVALTPNGRADAVTYVTYCTNKGDKSTADDDNNNNNNGSCNDNDNNDEKEGGHLVTEKLFMCAAEVLATLPELYHLLCANPPCPPARPLFVDMRRSAPIIAYAQMQNNCLELEYQHLHVDICGDVDSFGERVFGGPHEAANVWLGTPASVSSMHQDWVENLYAVVRGVKEFVLLPPWEGVFVPKSEFPSAAFTVKRREDTGGYDFGKAPARDGTSVPWMDVELTPADAEDDSLMRADLRGRLHPLVVYVRPGEVLYLPAMWLHRVAQHADEEDIQAIEESQKLSTTNKLKKPPLPLIAAVNYWYDMSFTNPAVVMLREFGLLL